MDHCACDSGDKSSDEDLTENEKYWSLRYPPPSGTETAPGPKPSSNPPPFITETPTDPKPSPSSPREERRRRKKRKKNKKKKKYRRRRRSGPLCLMGEGEGEEVDHYACDSGDKSSDEDLTEDEKHWSSPYPRQSSTEMLPGPKPSPNPPSSITEKPPGPKPCQYPPPSGTETPTVCVWVLVSM